MALHARFSNVFLMCSISNTLLSPPATLPDKLVLQISDTLPRVGNSLHSCVSSSLPVFHGESLPVFHGDDSVTRYLFMHCATFENQVCVTEPRPLSQSSIMPGKSKRGKVQEGSRTKQRKNLVGTSSSSSENAGSDGDKSIDSEAIQDMVRTFGDLVLGENCGTNLASYGDTRFTDLLHADYQSASLNATDKLPLVGGGENTRIAQNMEQYPDLQRHLTDFGVTPIDGPYAEASRRLPISEGVQKYCIPLSVLLPGTIAKRTS